MDFVTKLRQASRASGGCLCVGLDPRPAMLAPGQDLASFCLQVIEETKASAAAYKPNLAYFEAEGSAGLRQLERVLEGIPDSIPVVLDAKRGDIGATQEYYAKAVFGTWAADAVTVSPWMGYDSIEPMLAWENRGVYILGVTSNAGAADIELQRLADGTQVWQLAAEFARRAVESASPAQAGLVLGLTNAAEVLAAVPDVPLLIPGLGAQGGELSSLSAGPPRLAPPLVNVSRGLLTPPDHRSRSELAADYARATAALLA